MEIKWIGFLCLIFFQFNFSQDIEEVIIRPNSLSAGDMFGSKLILSLDHLYISAASSAEPDPYMGSVYIFEKNGFFWNQIQKINCPSSKPNTFFGSALAVKDSTLIVGAYRDSSFGFSRGAVYIFDRSTIEWDLKQKIFPEPDDDMLNKGFGLSIGHSDSLIIVGAPYDGPNFDSICGSIYVFNKENEYWKQNKKIYPQEIYHDGLFGRSIIVNDDFAFIGYPGASGFGKNSGLVLLYKIKNNDLFYDHKLTVNHPSEEQYFGLETSLFGDYLAIGAPGTISAPQDYFGSVYIFKSENGRWIEKHNITPNSDSVFSFGASVKLNNDSLLIGALIRSATNNYRGIGFLYTLKNDKWVKQLEFIASDGHPVDFFAQSCDVQSRSFIFGAPSNNFWGINAGAVYIYTIDPVNVNDNETVISNKYFLSQNFPNPFNPVTTIQFSIPHSKNVKLVVYDFLGREISVLADGYFEAGMHSVEFDGSNMASGVYYYRLNTNGYSESKKLILLK